MKENLIDRYNLDIQSIIPLEREDQGHGNELFKITDDNGDYFLKEIPSHSVRPNLELLYQELTECNPIKFKMVLPILSKENLYLSNIDGKEFMLYHFVEHEVLKYSQISLEELLGLLEELFTIFEQLEIPKHPFKTYENWFERGIVQLEKKVSEHRFLDIFKNYFQGRFPELELRQGNVHFDLNQFNIWISNGDLLVTDFDNAQPAAYAKDIFDIASNYLEINSDGITLLESDLIKIYSFSEKYIPNITTKDIQFLICRPLLGRLYDPVLQLSLIDVNKYLDHLVQFLEN